MPPQRTPSLSLCDRIHALPQELIDKIYDEILVMLKDTIPEHTIIKVDTSYRVPSILQLTHNLRNTHRKRYYILNDFDFDIPDIKTFEKWLSLVCRHAECDSPAIVRRLQWQHGVAWEKLGLRIQFYDKIVDLASQWNSNNMRERKKPTVNFWWQATNDPNLVE